MDQNIVDMIMEERSRPIIGVIGATNPKFPYDRKMGYDIGFTLRKYVEEIGGSIFTGGVHGVGVDVYRGIVNSSLVISKKKESDLDDRFFVLVPEFYMDDESKLYNYMAPEEYFELAEKYVLKDLDVVVAGFSMGERRSYISEIADALIVLNGSWGTFDEALKSIARSKPVITLPYSGGAAQMLETVKKEKEINRFPPEIRDEILWVDRDFIYVSSENNLTKLLGKILIYRE